METIDINDTVKSIIDTHPSFKQVMVDIGLDKVTNKNMLNTVGRFTPLKHGLKMKRVELPTLQKAANRHGFQIVDTRPK